MQVEEFSPLNYSFGGCKFYLAPAFIYVWEM